IACFGNSIYSETIAETVKNELREMSMKFLSKLREDNVGSSAFLEETNRDDLVNRGTGVEDVFVLDTGIRTEKSTTESSSLNLAEVIPESKSTSSKSPSGKSHRKKRSKCPGGVGNFGFNSFNLLTFALQAFNGVINTINNINNNNNNNNINSANNVMSNFNQQESNSNSMSMLVIVVPPGKKRKRREVWEKDESECLKLEHQEEIERVIEATFDTLSELIKFQNVEVNAECSKYILCLHIQNTYSRYGLKVLSEMSDKEDLWDAVVQPLVNQGKCSVLFPECTEHY
ncbi:hypothetical protein SK128_026185, partial [Halocaridina rubra]